MFGRIWLLFGGALVAASVVFGAGCGDGGGGDPTMDSGPGSPDYSLAADAFVAQPDGTSVDGEATGCGPETYPCGPYGDTVGDIVGDLTFEGYADEKYYCKKLSELSSADVRNVSLGDWYRTDPTCPSEKKRLLWLFITGGW